MGRNSEQPNKKLVNVAPKYGKNLVSTENLSYGEVTNKYITFSFRYFTQMELFGLEDQDNHWFVSLLEKFRDFSKIEKSIIEKYGERDKLRLHPIDWDAKNCPIVKKHIESVPKDILDNVKEFPFWQFQLSTGTGRVVGFFIGNIFYVVLLDPKHNLQPSKDFGYKVDKTEICLTQYEKILLRLAVEEKKRSRCVHFEQCPITNLQSESFETNTFYACVDKDLADKYIELMSTGMFQTKIEEFLLKEFVGD